MSMSQVMPPMLRTDARKKKRGASLPSPAKKRVGHAARNEDKHRSAWKKQILMTPEGRRICFEIRDEAWYQLMSSSPDKTYRRLAASILMASALFEARPKRFS